MNKTIMLALAATASLAFASPAAARYHHHRHSRYARHHGPSHVIPGVLVANPYGDVIIDGSTGFHRSNWGVMVPDSEPQSFVATGRASNSGIGGANGLPGRNWQ